MNFPPMATNSSTAATSNSAAAVKALLKWKDSQSSLSTTQKPLQLLPEDDFIYLNLTLKKIPPKPRTNPFKIPLPHPLLVHDSEFCLIIDDRPTSNLTKESAQKIIKSQNIGGISKVLKLSKLKTNYKPFEAKRKLCNSYDLFLVDRRIVHLLPKLLGKSFFKKKKLPLPLDLTHKNWKEQIERVLGCGLLYMRTGTCCVIKVGKVSMECEEIVENVVEAIKGAVEVVPKKWGGVRSFHLKLSDSLALPVYQALPDVKFRIEGAKESVKASDVEFKEAKGEEKNKKGEKNKKKGRIHEVNYMDIGAGEVELVSEDDEIVGTNVESEENNEGNKSEDDDGFDGADSGDNKSKQGKSKGVVLSRKRGKKVGKDGESEGKKKTSSPEGSISKKASKRSKAEKGLKEASPAKKAKRGKGRM